MVFEEFVVPDPPVAAGLLAAVVAVGLLLYRARPPVSQRVGLAVAPWMVLGALLHALYQMHRALGETLLPAGAVVVSAPSVYLTTGVFAGVTWLVVLRAGTEPAAVARRLAGVGTLALAVVAVYATRAATREFALDPVLPLAGLVGSLALTAVVVRLLVGWRPAVAADAGLVGGLVLFAHIFDAITTAIGIELLDVAERSTAPRVILDIAADLPTADLLGEAWLFVVVKLVLATALVAVFHDYVTEEPAEGTLFFTGIAAIGLGPGAHNFFLFLFGV